MVNKIFLILFMASCSAPQVHAMELELMPMSVAMAEQLDTTDVELYYAIEEDKHAEVAHILETSFNLHAQSPENRRVVVTDIDLNLFLHTAVSNYTCGMPRLLLDYGFDPNAVNPSNGNTPLIIAATGLSDSLCKLLIERGARTDTTNHSGKTALHAAAHQMDAYDGDKDMATSTWFTCQQIIQSQRQLNEGAFTFIAWLRRFKTEKHPLGELYNRRNDFFLPHLGCLVSIKKLLTSMDDQGRMPYDLFPIQCLKQNLVRAVVDEDVDGDVAQPGCAKKCVIQ